MIRQTLRRRGLRPLVTILLLHAARLGAAEDKDTDVLARVDGRAITAADVDRELSIAFPARKIDPQTEPALREQTVEQLVRRQLVLKYLRDSGQAATAAELDLAIDRLKRQLAPREVSWEAFLKSKQLDEAGLRDALEWQIGWQRLLDQYLTEENLRNYFAKHRRDYDGTELRVAHLLLPVAEGANPSARQAARERARQQAVAVREQIQQGTLSFAEAARQYSASPTKDMGGEIGWIRRREPMPEPFTQAAWRLDVGEVSEPVETTFGFHLIRVLETRPGTKELSDVRSELKQGVTQYLFEWIAERTRPQAKIER